MKNDLESMQVRQHRTWQERQTFGAWGQHARRNFLQNMYQDSHYFIQNVTSVMVI